MKCVDLWINSKFTNKISTSYATYKKILENYLPVKHQIKISYGGNGKPILSNISDLFFNVSHTESYLVIAISRNCEVGVDIERTDRCVPNMHTIIKKYFNQLEINLLENSPNIHKEFILYWVIKEAYVKMNGIGISCNLNSIFVDFKSNMVNNLIENTYHDFELINLTNNLICGIVPKFDHVKLCYF